ncbi:MAG: hypothetical protein ACK4PI_07680 [Tepidisphaerales bacterium]
MSHRHFRRVALFAAALTAVWPLTASTARSRPADAGPLAEHVPAGVVIYAGWSGDVTATPAFAASHVARLLASLDLPGWTDNGLYKLLEPEAAANPATPVLVDLFRTVVEYAWGHPAAFYSNGPGLSEDLQPAPHLCFLIRFPDDAAAAAAETDIQDRISSIIGGQNIPNVRFFRNGPTLAMSINDTSDVSPLAPLNKALARDAVVEDLFTRTHREGLKPAVHAYVNLERVWLIVDENNIDDPNHERNMAILGLRQARHLALTAGLDGADWASSLFVQLEPARTGVLGALTAPRPADDELLARVPDAAVSVLTFSLDAPDLLRRLQTEGERVSRGFSRQVLGAVNLAGAVLGVSSMDVLRNLGPHYALYALPGEGNFRYVLLSRPRDPNALAESLFTIAQSAGRILLAQRPDLPMVVTSRGDLDGRPLFTLAAGSTTLAWTVVDDSLLVTAGPDTLQAALSAMRQGRLTDLPDFTARVRRLAAPTGAALGYSNLAATSAAMHAKWAYAFEKQFPNVNPRVKHLPLPSAEQLAPHATYAVSALWSDDAGLYYRTLAPFPAAELFSANFGLIAGEGSLLEALRSLQQASPNLDDAATPDGSGAAVPGDATGPARQMPASRPPAARPGRANR